jgi:hypothetical protein
MRPLHLLLVAANFCLATLACRAEEIQTLPFVQDSWTLVVMPDTQVYAAQFPATFISQTQWIVDNAAKRNIEFVCTVGDITDNNSSEQWANAKAALSLLDGKVPYAVALGNHDYSSPMTTRESLANEYFPMHLVRNMPAYGGAYQRGKLDNAYYLFQAGQRDWIVIVLEFCPRDAVVRWASKVLDAHRKRSAIICTHAYMYYDNTRYNHRSVPKQLWAPYDQGLSGINDGEDLWVKLVSQHRNVVFVFSGHVLGTGVGRLTSTGLYGNRVHQILANYQMRPGGGEGYLRLVEFLPDGRTVQVKSYSPLLDKYLADPEQQFTVDLPPAL